MKKSFFLITLACLAAIRALALDVHYVFKASALLPVQIETLDKKGNVVISKISLGSKELVNLALARPVTKALDPHTMVLAVEVNSNNPNTSQLVVFNPTTQAIDARIIRLTTGAAPSVKASDPVGSADKSKGTGLSPGDILATDPAKGDTAKNGLATTQIYAAANGGWSPGTDFDEDPPKLALSATGMIGDIRGKMTKEGDPITISIDGVLVKGMFASSGKPIHFFFQ